MVASTYTIFLIIVRPYIKNEFNNFDVLSNSVIILSCFALSFYQTNISNELKLLLLIALMSFQLMFILVFLWKYYKLEISNYIEKRRDNRNIFVKIAIWI